MSNSSLRVSGRGVGAQQRLAPLGSSTCGLTSGLCRENPQAVTNPFSEQRTVSKGHPAAAMILP